MHSVDLRPSEMEKANVISLTHPSKASFDLKRNQEEIKLGHGGKRRGAGRKKVEISAASSIAEAAKQYTQDAPDLIVTTMKRIQTHAL